MLTSPLGHSDEAGNGTHRKSSGIVVLDEPVTPQEKSRYVREMFDAIAPRYNLLNSLLSLRIHHTWRKMAARCAALVAGESAIDVCTGTGDFAAELRRHVGPEGDVCGVDFSFGMLRSGALLFEAEQIEIAQADALNLPFGDNEFDAAVIGFGLRNVADPARGLAEMARVVKPSGRVVCLEFAQPRNDSFRAFYEWYGRHIMPRIGGAVSGASEAYTYLPQSVARWKSRDELSEMMREAGLSDVRTIDMTLGIVCIHVGTKRAPFANRNS